MSGHRDAVCPAFLLPSAMRLGNRKKPGCPMGPMLCAMRRIAAVGERRQLGLCLAIVIAFSATGAQADEGGSSFWLPGIFGSLAAVPSQPGWSFSAINYYTNVSASGNVALAREFEIGKIPGNVSASINASLHADVDIVLLSPAYTFATPVLGGQASVGLIGIYGRSSASLNGSLTGTATIPPFPPIPFTRTDNISNSVTGFGDLYPQFVLKWNAGVHNFMAYATGDVPVGTYNSTRLSNIGLGHGAIDVGGGYTYLDLQTGHEFSAVTGLTYNFTNPTTNYQSGVDWHLDWGASQFLSKQLSVGLVGYFYNQISGDSGSGDRIGSFKSRVIGLGPQVSFLFPVGQMQGLLNLKAYKEFDAQNRPEGWNAWVVFSISPAAPVPPAAAPMVTKAPPRY